MKSTADLLGRKMSFAIEQDGIRSFINNCQKFPTLSRHDVSISPLRDTDITHVFIFLNDSRTSVGAYFDTDGRLIAVYAWRLRIERMLPHALSETAYDVIDAMLAPRDVPFVHKSVPEIEKTAPRLTGDRYNCVVTFDNETEYLSNRWQSIIGWVIHPATDISSVTGRRTS